MKKITVDILERGKLVGFLPEKTPMCGAVPAILILPGGGYVAAPLESEDETAAAFFERGFAAFILTYSCGIHAVWPQPLIELSMAIMTIRGHAKSWGIRPDAVAVCGFSAGGHLAACSGTMWNHAEVQAFIGTPGKSNRPDAMVLGYPVTSIEMLHRDNGKLKLFPVDAVENVGNHTPPAFLIHSAEDQSVPVTQSLRMAQALSRANIPFDLHIYQKGDHAELSEKGNVLDNGIQIPGFYQWFSRCCDWLWHQFGMPKPGEFPPPPATDAAPESFPAPWGTSRPHYPDGIVPLNIPIPE